MRRSSALALSALLLAAIACPGAAPDLGPRLDAVEPTFGDRGDSTAVLIRGQFRVKAVQALSAASGDEVDATYQAWLDGTPLGQVRWLDERTLAAVVPGGLAEGPHGLEVQDPTGRRGALAEAFFAGIPTVALTQAVSLSRAIFSVGQGVVISVAVTNAGNVAARGVLPALALGGTGKLAVTSDPAAKDIASGATEAFDFGFTAAVPGTVAVDVATAVPSPTGGMASAPTWSGTALVQAPAALAVSTLSATPSSVNPGQVITLTLTVQNTGGADASSVIPIAPVAVGTGTVGLVTGPPLASFTLAGGQSQTFQWTFAAQVAGTVTFSAGASGADVNSGLPLAAGPASSGPVLLLRPAVLSAALVAPPTVSVGQTFSVSLDVLNAGDSAARGLAPSLDAVASTGACTPGVSPAPAVAAGGATVRFTRTFTATAPGTVTLHGSVAGFDATDALPVSAAASAALVVQVPAALAVSTLSATPSTVNVGQPFTLTMTVQNTGGAAASSVIASAPIAGGTGTARLLTGPTPPSLPVPGGQSRTFQWTFAAQGAGTVTIDAGASGADANSGLPVVARPATFGPVMVLRPASLSAALVAPATVSVGQTFSVSLDVLNAGDSAAQGLAPSLDSVASTGGACTAIGAVSPAPAVANGGATVRFTRSFTATAPGPVTFQGSVAGVDATDRLAASAAASTALLVQLPAALAVSLSATPSFVNLFQVITLTLTVQNTGGAKARDVTPSAPVAGGTSAALLQTGPTPASLTLAGGESKTFLWTYAAPIAGTVTFEAGAVGADANSGLPLAAGPATSGTIQVQVPAALAVVLSATPSTVSVGQVITLTLTVQNTGGADARDVAPSAPVAAGGGKALLQTGPPPAPVTVGGGQLHAFTWTFLTQGAGPITFDAGASGADVNSGLPVVALPATSGPIQVQVPAALTVSLSATPSSVNVGQVITLTLIVRNTGGAAARDVTPGAPVAGGTGTALLQTGPTPTSVTLSSGQFQPFQWTFLAQVAGPITFVAEPSGADANSGAPLAAGPATSGPVQVLRPALLSAALVAPPATVSVGQTFSLSLDVFNAGDTAAQGLAPFLDAVAGTGICAAVGAVSPASPVDAAGGTTVSFTHSFTATAPGAVTFQGSVTGVDAKDARVVSASASAALLVQAPAALAVSLSATPSSVNVDEFITLTLIVQNTGVADARDVIPGAPVAGGTGAALLQTGPTPRSTTLPGGQFQTFTWTFAAQAAGTVTFTFDAGASGADANSGLPLAAGPATSGPVEVLPDGGPGAAPTVTSTLPANGATGVPHKLPISATFSQAMDPATLSATTFTVKQGTTDVSGAVTVNGAAHSATFTPDSPLQLNRLYTATITTGAKDPGGLALAANYSWSFTTAANAAPPTVISTNPRDLATNICVPARVDATFDKLMDPLTITPNFTLAGGPGPSPVTGNVSYDTPTNTASFVPSSSLVGGTTYTARVSTGAKDAAGNALAQDEVWTFTLSATPCTPPINLRGISSFGVASRAGLTSTGVTVVNGNVALYPLATCTDSTGNAGASQTCLVKTHASPTGMTVNGSILFAGDPFDNGKTANSVTNDLNLAWIEGKAKIVTNGTVAGDELGGKTFNAGVYHNASLGLAANGVATMDAQNDLNAVFIFQVDSSMTDSGILDKPTQIKLVNGAQAKNIYFVVGLDVTIGSGTIWNGTILAGRTVTMNDGSTVNGRVLAGASGAGAFTLTGAASPSKTTITVPQ